MKGIPFDLTDKDVAGPDIFQKLIPMEAHEHASLYRSAALSKCTRANSLMGVWKFELFYLAIG